MGTRNLTMAIVNGETKIAQYGQWDGYPEGQGVTALLFLRDNDLQAVKEKIGKVAWLSKEEIEEIDKKRNWADLYPHLSRDRGADILELAYKATEPLKLVDSSDFAADSLFCEWAYVIDFDKGTFEVYKGFNKKPLEESDRFFPLQGEKSEQYYPIKLAKSFELDKLPTKEEFLKAFESKDDE